MSGLDVASKHELFVSMRRASKFAALACILAAFTSLTLAGLFRCDLAASDRFERFAVGFGVIAALYVLLYRLNGRRLRRSVTIEVRGRPRDPYGMSRWLREGTRATYEVMALSVVALGAAMKLIVDVDYAALWSAGLCW